MFLMKARVLCLDVGDKRIGVAVSDPMGFTAQGLATLERRHFKQDCAQILEIIKEVDAKKLIIGFPLDMEDKEGPQAKKVLFFFEGLKKFLKEAAVDMEMEFCDESFSTQEGEAILLQADLSRKKRRKIIDKLAASLILQRYLEEKND